jgi:hypothetical protein
MGALPNNDLGYSTIQKSPVGSHVKEYSGVSQTQDFRDLQSIPDLDNIQRSYNDLLYC